MKLSNASNIRFNGSDVKLAKINGIIVYKKEEEDALLIARYTANASGVLPTFNDTFEGYETEEVNNNGIYTVTILTNKEDNLPTSISFDSRSELLTVEYLKVTSKVTSMYYMFKDCKNLTSVDASNWNTSNVTDMSNMFYGCYNLTSLDVSSWDTSNVTTMASMFQHCYELTSLDVSNWNTSNVTDMSRIFYNCYKITPLSVSNWNTSNVTDMYGTFCACRSLTSLDVSSWDTSNTTVMRATFNGCYNLTSLDVSSWDTSNVTTMAYMFYECLKLTSLDLSNFDASNVTDMFNMFNGCYILTSLGSMKNIRVDLLVPTALNRESILDVIDNLATVQTAKTLKMSTEQLSWISEDKIKEANNKGWTISA